MPAIRVDAVGESDIGLVRERNEDVFLIVDLGGGHSLGAGQHHLEVGDRGLVFAVLDGMGGAAGGDRASRLASEVFTDAVLAAHPTSRPELVESVIDAVEEANRQIREEALAEPGLQGMGTTLTAAAVIDDTLVVVHVGDSRAYLSRNGRLVQVTEDQSLIQELVATGQIPPEEVPLFEHNNVILQALGVTEALRPFAAEIPLQDGDLLLLCTDGLTTTVPHEEIAEALTKQGESLEATARALTSLARMHGGHDNVTLVLGRFEGAALPSTAPGSAAAGDPSVRRLVVPTRRRAGLSPMALVVLAVLLMAVVAGVILLIGMD